jgi:uncharacterized protein (TIGR03000 family)
MTFRRLHTAAALLALVSLAAAASAGGTWFPNIGTFATFPGNQQGYGLGFYSPSYYGYPLNDTGPGYYGGGDYTRYYAYGRGYAFGDYRGPVPGKVYYGDWREDPGAYPLSPPPAFLAGKQVPPQHAAPVPAAKAPEARNARVVVQVPADARVWFDDNQTGQKGSLRRFVTPGLTPGEKFTYEIRARWKQDGRDVEQTQTVAVQAGSEYQVTFPREAAGSASWSGPRLPSLEE